MLKAKRLFFRYAAISLATAVLGILSPEPVVADGVSFSGSTTAEQVAGAAVKVLTKSRNAVYAQASNRCGSSSDSNTSSLFVDKAVTVNAPPPPCGIPGSAKSTAETHPALGPNNDRIVLNPQVLAPTAGAFAWGKIGSVTQFLTDPSGPVDVLLRVQTDITLRNSVAGDPSAVAFSLTDLPPTNFDQSLGQQFFASDFLGFQSDFSNAFSQELMAAGFSGASPGTSFITLVAYLGPNGLEVMATDYLGNILLTASDFTVFTVDGVTTATFSGELSTVIRVNSGQEFNLSFESYGAAAAESNTPEPAALVLLGTGLAGVVIKMRKTRR